MTDIVVRYADTMQELHDPGYAVGDVNDKNLLALSRVNHWSNSSASSTADEWTGTTR